MNKSHFHLDPKVQGSSLILVIFNFLGLVWYASSVNTMVETLIVRVNKLETWQDVTKDQLASINSTLARIDERLVYIAEITKRKKG